MRAKNLYLRVLYKMNEQVFNVGKESPKSDAKTVAKTHRQGGKEYAFISSENIKHCLREKFLEISEVKRPVEEFYKATKKSVDSGEQGAVSTVIEVDNPMCLIFGAWRSEAKKDYEKLALTAQIKVAKGLPISTKLQTLHTSDDSVHRGGENCKILIAVKSKENEKENCDNAETLAKKLNISEAEAQEIFDSKVALNFYQTYKTASGLYITDFAIDLNRFGKIELKAVESYAGQEKVEELLAHGWSIVSINNVAYLSPSEETLLQWWEWLVDSLIEWDLMSNNSNNGTAKMPLRYTCSLNANDIQDGTRTSNGGARLVIDDSIPTLTSFNRLQLDSLECGYDNGADDVEASPVHLDRNAQQRFRDALIEIGKKEIYFK